jgi:hypothetical protein
MMDGVSVLPVAAMSVVYASHRAQALAVAFDIYAPLCFGPI